MKLRSVRLFAVGVAAILAVFSLLLATTPPLLARARPTPTPTPPATPTPTPVPPPAPSPTPPPATGSPFAIAYSASVAESISQASGGSFVVGALCDGANCNGPATVLRVDSSGNILSQTQYRYGNGSQST